MNYPALVCQLNGASHPCSRLNSTIGTTQHIIYLPISQTVASLASGGIVVSGVYNPVGVGTSGNFEAKIYDSVGSEVESSSGSNTVTTTATTGWTLLSATTRNYSTNAAQLEGTLSYLNNPPTSLHLTLMPPYSFQAATTLTLTLSSTTVLSYDTTHTQCINTHLPACSISTSGTNLVFSFNSTTFGGSVGTVLSVEITNLTIFTLLGVSVAAEMGVAGLQSVSGSTSLNTVSGMYITSVSDYSATLSSYLLGDTGVTATLTINSLSTELTSQLN